MLRYLQGKARGCRCDQDNKRQRLGNYGRLQKVDNAFGWSDANKINKPAIRCISSEYADSSWLACGQKRKLRVLKLVYCYKTSCFKIRGRHGMIDCRHKSKNHIFIL